MRFGAREPSPGHLSLAIRPRPGLGNRGQARENPAPEGAGAEGATAPVNSQAQGTVLSDTLESGASCARRRDNDLRRPRGGRDRGGIRGADTPPVHARPERPGEKENRVTGDLLTLRLDDLHRELGARMVPFAGYSMPVQYPAGVMKEHLHTRDAAGLFDVSHMGQIILRPKTDMEALALALETVIPADVAGLKENRQRYGIFTNDEGGILDDFMFANRGDHFLLVVNASRKHEDLAHLQAHLSDAAEIEMVGGRCLFALQGPQAEAVLAAHVADAGELKFMDSVIRDSAFGELWISRSGYTGEDGFEISVPDAGAEDFARALLGDERVAPVGLGARDSLRLESGLCLYGNDIDETVSPVEAGLNWAIQKVRRRGGAREGGFPGAGRILREIEDGAARIRVGLSPEGRAPMREGTVLFHDGQEVGRVTSGGFGPSIEAPMAMGYVPPALSAPGTALEGEVRNRRLPATVVKLPFHTPTYKR